MKPAAKRSLVNSDQLPRSAVESVVRQATRAAAPDYYVQKATGRALTRLVLIVAGVQVSGVLLWLSMVFAGVVDASMNLDAFMVSQLVVFIASIVIGLVVTVRYLKSLRGEAEQLEPGVAAPMFDLLQLQCVCDEPDDIDEWLSEYLSVDTVVDMGRPERMFGDESREGDCRIMDVRRNGEDTGGTEILGLVLSARPSLQIDGRIVIEPAGEATLSLEADGLEDVPMGAEMGEFLSVRATDVDEATVVIEDGQVAETLRSFYEEARRRDRLWESEEGTGDFSVVLSTDSVEVLRRSQKPLFPSDEDAGDTTVDELMASAREVQSAVRIVEAVEQTVGHGDSGGPSR